MELERQAIAALVRWFEYGDYESLLPDGPIEIVHHFRLWYDVKH